MNEHSISLLEIPRILDELAEYCLTTTAAERAHVPHGFTTASQVEACLDEVGFWKRVLDVDDPWSGLSFPDVGRAASVVRVEGAVVDGEQLAAVARFVLSSHTLAQRMRDREDAASGADAIAVAPPLHRTAQRIATTLDVDGSVVEKAVPALRELGNRMRSITRTLQQKAQAYLTDERHRSAFAADVPTQKDGRLVLPMKASQKNRLGGVVYDVSQTGSTVYVEPPEILEQNNQLREAQAAYRAEVQRFLRELTGSLRAVVDDLDATVEQVTTVDLHAAKARYARAHRCTRVRIDEQHVALHQARHPLLGRGCVPMDLLMPKGTRILIITGPNTGGKTVALKTIGVLAFLLRLGMELPVGDDSAMPLFDRVFADIGDEQSLQQSLSTFSAHMKNVGEIVRSADSRSLVLLDELGAGTDPEEGGALALAVVDTLVERAATAVITTHHSALKHYGYTHAEVENASVEFDREQLRPTYRLIIGVPGSSHALHIARRHGLPDATVRAAEHYLGEQRSDSAAIIEELSSRQAQLREEESALAERFQRQTEQEERIAEREHHLSRREAELQREKSQELERFVAETRRRLENLVRELREGELTRERTAAVKEFLGELSAESDRERAEADRRAERARRTSPGELQLESGARVRILGSRREATVVRKLRGDQWQVEVGSLRMTVSERELEVVAAPRKPAPVKVEVPGGGEGPRPQFELDVRGMRLEEAVSVVTEQLDRAMQSGMREFGIIHGLGTGVLQQGIRALLAEYQGIRYEYARPEEGGYGKTWVHLHLD